MVLPDGFDCNGEARLGLRAVVNVVLATGEDRLLFFEGIVLQS